jgi:hypothetical protein
VRELTFIGPVGKVRRDGKNTGPQAAFIENAERIARVSEAGGARCRRLWRQAPLPRGRVSQLVTLPRVVFCAFRSDTDTGASFLPWKICEQLTRNPPPFSCRPGHTVIQLSRVFRPLATSTHCRCGRTRRDGLAGARYGPAPALPSEVSSKGAVGGVVGGALARFFFKKKSKGVPARRLHAAPKPHGVSMTHARFEKTHYADKNRKTTPAGAEKRFSFRHGATTRALREV